MDIATLQTALAAAVGEHRCRTKPSLVASRRIAAHLACVEEWLQSAVDQERALVSLAKNK